ncbi:MAG: hypothetical protein ABJB66_08810 [Gemmatimonadaceae bacterium]
MLTKRIALLLITLAPSAALLAQRNPDAQRTEVPVRSVMLFSSGVGYFEHAGKVRGDGATELRFKTNQINDILKSLVLQDEDGGKVTTITYPSQDPLSKTLRSFQVDITQNPSLADLLNQLRGAKVTIQLQTSTFTGSILGVENRSKALPSTAAIDVPVLNLLSGANIRSIELQSISNLTLDDAGLQEELTKALVALSQARDQDKKTVTINFTGNGERRVRIGYVVESPIWKTSYRLLLNDKSSRIQGWAIVENQTESDWNGVSLSLVSGRPISFNMDLYQPLYLTRPTVTQELFAGLRPQVYDGGIASDRAPGTPVPGSPNGYAESRPVAKGIGSALAAATPALGGGRAGASGNIAALRARAEQQYDMAADSTESVSVQSIATAAKMGELFQYTIPNVTLARQKSAMIPIVTDSIGIERISIYNASVLSKNPLNGVRLKNTTGKHLLQGPVTVLDSDHYAGDARIDNVPPGQERLLSYGIDLEVLVDNTKNGYTSAVSTAKILKGTLVVTHKDVSSQQYLVDNKSEKEKNIVIEHPVRRGWVISNALKPVESTESLHRFQLISPAKRVTTFTVNEEQVRSETVSMLDARQGPNQLLLLYSRTGEIPANVREAIAKALTLQRAASETKRLIDANSQQRQTFDVEANRMRENMKVVGQSTAYYKRLLLKLDEQESAIEKLQHQSQVLREKYDAEWSELTRYVENLTVD